MRCLDVRMRAHKRSVESAQPQRSAVAEYVHELGHAVEGKAATVIDIERDWRRRKIKGGHIHSEGGEKWISHE